MQYAMNQQQQQNGLQTKLIYNTYSISIEKYVYFVRIALLAGKTKIKTVAETNKKKTQKIENINKMLIWISFVKNF